MRTAVRNYRIPEAHRLDSSREQPRPWTALWCVFKRYSIRQESVQRAAMEKVAAYLEGPSATPSVAPLQRQS